MRLIQNSSKLQAHINSTYINLRYGIAAIGVLIPIVMIFFGKFICNIDYQNSISAYFHADHDGYLLRTLFVGCLWAVGIALMLYKGYSKLENRLLNAAGFFAIGVAIFPMTWPDTGGTEVIYQGIDLMIFGKHRISLHGLCAVLMFACMACVCIWCASDTLHAVQNEKRRIRLKRTYTILGIGMFLFPIGAWLLTLIFNISDKVILFVELAAIFTFSLYWFIKSREIAMTKVDTQIWKGEFLISMDDKEKKMKVRI